MKKKISLREWFIKKNGTGDPRGWRGEHTITALSKHLGCSYQQTQRYLDGTTHASPTTLAEIRKFTNNEVSVERIVNEH